MKRNEVPNMLKDTAKAPCSERKINVNTICRHAVTFALYLKPEVNSAVGELCATVKNIQKQIFSPSEKNMQITEHLPIYLSFNHMTHSGRHTIFTHSCDKKKQKYLVCGICL